MWSPQTSLVLLRIVVGAWFLKAVWTKLVLVAGPHGVSYPVVAARFLTFYPKRVAEFASDNPLLWYKHFLEGVVLPHATLFATLQAYAEVIVAVGLVLGLFTRLAAALGLFLALNYGLASQWMSFGQQGFHLLLVTSMVTFILSGAGRVWGVDELLVRFAKRHRWLGVLV
jgi:thiosulfate dehydrogenase [quinone] large subunit